MKQILTYLSPDKKFNAEHAMAVKIQIDNSISLGWRKEDIILATNFEYEYNGVSSLVIGDDNYCEHTWPATKIYVIVELFKRDLIGEGLYWYHDFDCFQLNEFGDVELEKSDMGLTNYGRMPRLCSASMFFKKEARDIFYDLKKEIDRAKTNEEISIARMINSSSELKKRIKLLNITYAFHRFNLPSCYKIADKPIKAAHFHLTPDKYRFYVEGENKLNMVLIPNKLINIFNKHGFTK